MRCARQLLASRVRDPQHQLLSSPVSQTLAAARTALAKQRYEPALIALLDAWREVRAVQIARLVDRVSPRVTRRPLAHKPVKKANERWQEVAAERDPLDLPRLLGAMASANVVAAKKRVDVLATFPADPRMAPGLATLLAVGPYFASQTGEALAATARTMILEAADERVIAALEPYADRPDMAKLLADVRAAIAPVELAPADRQLCDELQRMLGSSPDELLAAIYDAPRDDGPREVYADWLIEHGEEAHGEWIQLQLRAARGALPADAAARMAELWTGLERRLEAPFTKVTESSSRVFERGFLTRCHIRVTNSRALPSAAADPAWQTVEEVVIDDMFVDQGTLALPAFRNLRRLRSISYAAMLHLARGAPRPLEFVGLSSLPNEPVPEPETWGLAQLTAITLPTLRGPAGLDWLWATRLGAQLRWLGVDLSGIGDWIAAVPSHLKTVTSGMVECRREGERWAIVVDPSRGNPMYRTTPEQLHAAIARIARARIASLTVPDDLRPAFADLAP